MSCRPSNKLSSTSLMERSVYQERWRKLRPQWCLTSRRTAPSPHHHQRPPNSAPISAHYSFDMAQQVFCPNNPLQPGPMYFLTPRKCAIFGVCCESIPRQMSSMKLSTWGRAPTPSSACSTTSLKTMGWARREYTCMPTTVVGRTKMRSWCVESDDRPAQGDHTLIHDSRPHKVQPRLVLRTPEKKVQEDRSRWSSGLGRGHE